MKLRISLAMLAALPLLAVGSGAAAGTSTHHQNGLLAARGPDGISLIDTRTSSVKVIPHTAVTMQTTGVTAWSPDGSRLVFEAWGEDTLSLYSATANGSDRRLLLRDGSSPSWSPDGKHLAFISENGGSSNLYTWEADGGQLKQLTFEVDGVFGATWSPDGEWIAFFDADGVNRVRADGTGRRLLEPDELAQSPTWSPDGKWIAFVGRDGIYRMRADGTARERLIREEVATGLSWSPDGSKIVFDRLTGKAPSMEIAVLEIGSGKRSDVAVRLASGFAPVWSPDGKQLAFSASAPGSTSIGGCGGHAGGEVWVMNADGTSPRRIVKGDYGAVTWGALAPGLTAATLPDAG